MHERTIRVPQEVQTLSYASDRRDVYRYSHHEPSRLCIRITSSRNMYLDLIVTDLHERVGRLPADETKAILQAPQADRLAESIMFSARPTRIRPSLLRYQLVFGAPHVTCSLRGSLSPSPSCCVGHQAEIQPVHRHVLHQGRLGLEKIVSSREIEVSSFASNIV